MFKVQGAGCRVQGAGFRVQGSGFRIQGSGSRVQGPGSRVQGVEFTGRVWRCNPAAGHHAVVDPGTLAVGSEGRRGRWGTPTMALHIVDSIESTQLQDTSLSLTQVPYSSQSSA